MRTSEEPSVGIGCETNFTASPNLVLSFVTISLLYTLGNLKAIAAKLSLQQKSMS